MFPIYIRKYRKYKHDVIQGLELGRTQCKGRVAGSPWFTWCNPGVEITTRPVYTVCASAVISPLRQWLDSYAKTRFKMCHTFKHLLICNTFCCRLILLSLSLYIELALVCCTNPNNVNCLGTIFPNLNFVFASIWAASPVHIESDQYRSCSTVKLELDPCLIYDTDRYGWIWGSLCACASARRHCRRLQPIVIGYSRPSSWPERSHAV